MKPRKSSGSVRKESKKAKKSSARTPELVIITGMSGSGKASVLKAFEDLGYYCVDNLPVELIPSFAELALQSRDIRRTALVVDVREGSKLEKLPGILQSVRKMIPTKVVFLEASDAILLRRFSETRRPHPLGTDSPGENRPETGTPASKRHPPLCRLRHRHVEVQCARVACAHQRAFSRTVGGKKHSCILRQLRVSPGSS